MSRSEMLSNKPDSPKTLLQSFFEIQRLLVDTHDMRQIGFSAK